MIAIQVAARRPKPANTPLYDAATTGDLDGMSELLAADATLNIYQTSADDEPLLADVIRARHSHVADRMLDVYEADLSCLQAHFDQHPVEPKFWLTEKILVACGDDLCDAVETLVTESIRLPRFGSEDRRGLIVLLKRNTPAPAKVLWLSPGQQQTKAADDRRIAQIIETIYVGNGGGMLSVLQPPFVRKSLLALAARHGLSDVFFRLHAIYGESLAWDNITELWPLLCHLVAAKETVENHLKTLEDLVDRLALFQLDELFAFEGAWSMLDAPLELQLTSVFEYLLEAISKAKDVQPCDVLNELLQKSTYLHPIDGHWWNVECQIAPFVNGWIRHGADLMQSRNVQQGYVTLQTICAERTVPDEQAGDLLVQYNDRLCEQVKTCLDIFNRLVQMARLPAMRKWFGQCPATFALMYDQGHRMYNHIYGNIGSNGQRMEMAEFLFDQCQKERLEERTISNYVRKCAEHKEAYGMLVKLLQLPQCVDVAAGWQPWGDARSPMFSALMAGCPRNFQLLFDSVRDKAAIKAMKEFNGDNILAAAIYSRHQIPDLFVFDGYLCAEDESPSTVVKSTKSEEESEAVRVLYSGIFESLIQIGCDPLTAINESGQTLIHFAVITDNVPALRRLLELGLNPNQTDGDGNMPLHLVRSTAMFRELLPLAGGTSSAMSAVNLSGQTPLTAVCRTCQFLGTDPDVIELLNAMREAGGDCTAICDTQTRATALHYVYDSVPLTGWLLANGADINALNADGDTALHRQLMYRNFDVVAVLLAAPGLKWNLVSNSGQSYLGLLVCMSEENFERIRPLLAPYANELERLFHDHCNDKDSDGIAVLHTAIRSDTNAYCLQQLLRQGSRLNLANLVAASVGDPAAIRLALELCGAQSATERASNVTSGALTRALGHPSFEDMVPCVESVRALIGAGVRATGLTIRRTTQVQWVLEMLNRRGQRKAVVTILAALIAAGAEYAKPLETCAGPLKENTVFRCLLEE